MKRSGILFLLVAVLLALGFSQLNAQGNITLEGLAARIVALEQQGPKLDRLIVRVAELEMRLERLEPTPTATPRPTATPNVNATATARARYRATQVAQANAKATRQAQARATEEAKDQLSEVEYLEVFTENAGLVTMAMEGLTMSFRRPQPNDSSWRKLLNAWLGTFSYVQEELSAVIPPSSLKRGHDTFLRGIAYCISGADLIAEGVENLENDKFTEAAVEFEECTRITTEAIIMVGR